MKKDKPKKEKILYIDDGRSLADFSALDGKKKTAERRSNQSLRQPPRLADCARTYWEAVKMMFIPCLVTIGIIGVAFFIMWLLAK